jgi:hypothetical protein
VKLFAIPQLCSPLLGVDAVGAFWLTNHPKRYAPKFIFSGGPEKLKANLVFAAAAEGEHCPFADRHFVGLPVRTGVGDLVDAADQGQHSRLEVFQLVPI